MSRVLFSSVVVVLLAGVLTPRSVDASCGDWLQHSGSVSGVTVQQASKSHSVQPVQRQLPPADFAAPRTDVLGLPSPSVPAKPCDGPLCGQLPSFPLPAPMVPLAERPHHDAVWKACSQTLRVGGFQHRRWEQSVDLPRGVVIEIDRPPQGTFPLA
jgi:hypothetical protein